ncbi:MAG TPA: SGNH/GDSL hydrolase family protein [Polyangiaceae bacterium]|nr:SGNH/GDSL hydrolase family protein [Polyangiaceae bacterium]
MQEPRRRCRLEQLLLSVALCGFAACAAPAREQPAVVTAPVVPSSSAEPAPTGEPAVASEQPSGVTAAEPLPSQAKTEPQSAPADLPKGTLVLHVGDSFAASLGVPLGKRFKAAGVRYILEFETASYVPTWAFGEALPKYVGKYNPDLVMVTLGANEIEIPNPEQRAGAVKRLVKHLGGRPCVWVLPPLWKADTGFMKVISESSAPCRVIDSTSLVGDLPRKKDKIHPNEEGREVWADAVFGWLSRELESTSERPWTFKAP